MKNSLPLILFSLLIISCSGDNSLKENPYLPNVNISARFDLSLPEYNRLTYPGNYYVTHNYGINGIVIFNLNSDQYLAFELTDPNHIPQECSLLIVDGNEARCSCGDGNTFMINTGQQISGGGEYGLKPYRVIRSGNYLEVTN